MATKKNIMFVLIIALCILMVVVSGCGPSGDPGDKSDPGKDKVETKRISMATGGTGGVYYPYGGVICNIISKNIPGLEAGAEVTASSVENIRLIESGEAQLATISDDMAYDGLHGEGVFDRAVPLRAIVEMYPQLVHVVSVKGNGIEKVEDLRGKKFSVGAPGSGMQVQIKNILGALGITFDDFTVFQLTYVEQVEALRDKVIDAGTWSVAPPIPTVMDLASTHKISILPFSNQEMDIVEEAYPFYKRTTLEGGTYDGVDEDLQVIAVWNCVAAHKDMPEEEAYQITKAIFEHNDEIVQVHPGAIYTVPENIKECVIPLHPGTVRYLEEIGVEVPDRLIPPEMK